MSKRSRQVQQWLAATATVIGVTAVAYFTSPDNNSGDIFTPTVIKAPAWYITNADHYSFDIDGKLDNHSTADKAIHFDHSDISFITKPLIESFDDNILTQVASSDNAKVKPDQTILLTDNVIITTVGNSDDGNTVLATEVLLINTLLNTADTKEPVTITQLTGVTKATGMHADFDKAFISLLSGVHSVYEP